MKVFMLYNWTYFCSLDEEFLSRNILNCNILFAFSSQFCRWKLDSFETHWFELLSGNLLGNSVSHSRIFWPIFLSLNCTIISIGCFALVIKKFMIYKKNRNRVQEIHIILEDQEKKNGVISYNNQTHNISLLGYMEIVILSSIAIAIMVGFTVPFFLNLKQDYGIHWYLLFLELGFQLFSGLVFPIYIISKKKVMRRYLWNEIKNIVNH